MRFFNKQPETRLSQFNDEKEVMWYKRSTSQPAGEIYLVYFVDEPGLYKIGKTKDFINSRWQWLNLNYGHCHISALWEVNDLDFFEKVALRITTAFIANDKPGTEHRRFTEAQEKWFVDTFTNFVMDLDHPYFTFYKHQSIKLPVPTVELTSAARGLINDWDTSIALGDVVKIAHWAIVDKNRISSISSTMHLGLTQTKHRKIMDEFKARKYVFITANNRTEITDHGREFMAGLLKSVSESESFKPNA